MTAVSIIIPTYNRANYVTCALDSVLNQTFKDYEVIVIDDGSVDDTYKKLKSYLPKVKYIYQENSGVSQARNSGIEVSKGEWIAFLDSDDEWMPTYLSSQMQRVEKYRNAVMHVTNMIVVGKDGKHSDVFDDVGLSKVFRGRDSLLIDNPLEFLIKYHVTNVQSSLIKRDVIVDSGMFNVKYNVAEDTDIMLRVGLMGAITVLKEPHVCLFRRDEGFGNLSSCGFIKTRYNLIDVYSKLRENQSVSVSRDKILRKSISSQHRTIGNRILLSKKNRKLARKHFRRANRLHSSLWNIVKYLSTFLSARLAQSIIRRRRDGKIETYPD